MDDLISRQAAIDAVSRGCQEFRGIFAECEKNLNALPAVQTCDDAVSRQAAIDAMCELMHNWFGGDSKDEVREIKRELEKLPSAQPDYQDVLGWLLAYHTMSFDLHGRYLPHEVISWLINDFTREFIAVREQDE